MAENLTGKQQKAVLALLAEPTIGEAAQAATISERTLYRWLNEPSFCQAYREARRGAVKLVTGRLQQVAGRAVTTLDEVMRDPIAPAPARVAAAKAVLELAIKAVEVEDLEARLQTLESVLEHQRELAHAA